MKLSQQQVNTTTIPGRKRDRIRFLRQFPGLEAEVARQCEVSRSAVSKVVHGNSRSDRVWEALLAAIAKRLEAQEGEAA